MEGGNGTRGATKRKRSYSRTSQPSLGAVLVASEDHHSKRSSSAASRARRQPSNLKLMNTNIDDLPDVVLVDILCRLPRYASVCKYKSVCKRWSNLISEPYFIGRFLLGHPRRRLKQLPLVINRNGESFPYTLKSSSKLVTPVFKKIMSSLSLKKELVVVGACNDLVLCCASEYLQRDYFICNPYTLQWVALPPPSRVLRHVPVGFICDRYYNCYNKDVMHHPREETSSGPTFIDDGHGQLININAVCRCKVVRILPYDDDTDTIFEDKLSFKFKVEIFSFGIGEWRESVISFPREFSFDRINSDMHFAHNGMLYWSSKWGVTQNFLIGLDPFMISTTSSSNSGDDHQYHYECRFTELLVNKSIVEGRADNPLYNPDGHNYQIQCLSVPGCLQMCALDSFDNSVLVWELKEEEEDLIIATGKLFSNERDLIIDCAEQVELISFDPQDESVLYVKLDGVHGVDAAIFLKINVRTGHLVGQIVLPSTITNYCFFPLMEALTIDAWWPTPVPRLI